ncbi:MAG TPA: hypothetical protein VGK72_12085, partial [Chthoniobacterales bacterium]
FRTKKKLDHSLEGILRGIYLPLYTMVTFTRVPYAQAARRARRQDQVVYLAVGVIALLALVAAIWLAVCFLT